MLGFHYWDLKNSNECRGCVREIGATTGPLLDFALDGEAYLIPHVSAIWMVCARESGSRVHSTLGAFAIG